MYACMHVFVFEDMKGFELKQFYIWESKENMTKFIALVGIVWRAITNVMIRYGTGIAVSLKWVV